MREILFRGQTRKLGEKVKMDGTPVDGHWVCGGIYPGKGDRCIIYTLDPIDKYPVHSDTVGQFTGLYDKNGVKIFEGDIIRWRHWDEQYRERPVQYDHEWNRFCVWINGAGSLGVNKHLSEDIEVIGNIYDNPVRIDKTIQKERLVRNV